jgi:hypothetical protein
MRLGKDKQAKFLAVFLLLSASAWGQAGRTFKYHFKGDLQKSDAITSNQKLLINYSISELTVENIINEYGSFFRIQIPGHTPSTTPGKPELPILSRLITIPERCSFKIKISEVNSTRVRPSSEKIEGILFPAQEGETKEIQQKKHIFAIDKATYSTGGFIGSDTTWIEPLGKVRNKRLANLIISPVRYNAKSNLLEVITSMKIEIAFAEPDKILSKSPYIESQLFTKSLDKGVLNYNPEDLVTGYSDKPVRMVILTDTTFLKHLQPLLRWKTQKGFKLNVLTRGPKDAGTTYTELKATLSKLWNASSENNPPPEYLLIIGDVNKVPYYGTGTSGNVTDMYYGEFDGGEDFIPDMFIGRLPVADTTELKSVVKKIIQYEKFEFADTNKYYLNALVTAGNDDSYGSYMNGQVRYAITNYLTAVNKIREQHFYYPQPYLQQKDSIIKLINRGTSFINYSGHGDAKGWLHRNSPPYDYFIEADNVQSFSNNNMYPFVVSNACRTAQFNLTSSLGNIMVKTGEKGAIGFIGCSNDSYWDEDFYWAVGAGTPSANPAYESSGLGAYDRLFHTHNELPSDWYLTMGQINYAGNLAVSASTSLKKKYYWETYNLVGDPSIIPIIGQPDSFKKVLPDTLPNGIKSLSISVEPFAYVAVSHFDTLWDASFASPSGSVVLDMPGLSNDSCLFVITGQNKIPVIKKVYFSKVTGEFLNLTSTRINDSSGNNNGQADFGETFSLGMTISNLGLTNASGVYAKLSSSSKWVAINKDSVSVGTIAARSEIVISNGFPLTVSSTVPDKGIIPFELIVKDQLSEKHYKVDIKVHAPKLEIYSCRIDDSMTGNKDFIADPGETINLIFQVINQGSSNTSGKLNVSSPDDKISILDESKDSGNLQFGDTSEIVVKAVIAKDAKLGIEISILSSLVCTPYIINKDFLFRVGRVRESFESSSFKVFPWINLSSIPWTITGSNSFDGNLSARSGAITHNGTTSLIIRTILSQADSVRFYYKVSSEQTYDYLSFQLNGKEIFRKSGDVDWQKKVVPVPAGVNKLEWVYKKDLSVSGGADAAWIDMIDFSVAGSVSFIQRDIEVAKIVSPAQSEEPGKELVTLKLLNYGQDTIKGFNLAYSINNSAPVKQFFDKTTLFPYHDSVTVSFTTKADLSRYGIYEVWVYSFDNNDNYTGNDSLKIRIENRVTDQPLVVFPNPFTDQFKVIINSRNADTAKITLVSLSGMKLYSIEKKLDKGANIIIINENNVRLSPAVYYLNIDSHSINKSIPVIKIRH